MRPTGLTVKLDAPLPSFELAKEAKEHKFGTATIVMLGRRARFEKCSLGFVSHLSIVRRSRADVSLSWLLLEPRTYNRGCPFFAKHIDLGAGHDMPQFLHRRDV